MSDKIAKGRVVDRSFNGTLFRLIDLPLYAVDHFDPGDKVVVILESEYLRLKASPPDTPAEETGKMQTPPPQETWPAEVTVTGWDALRKMEEKLREYRRREDDRG